MLGLGYLVSNRLECALFVVVGGRRHCIQTERFSGLHSLSAAQRCHSGPGGEGKDHPRSPTWMPGPLQHLRPSLPEPGSLCGESQWFLLQLWAVSLHWILLSWRYIYPSTHWRLLARHYTDLPCVIRDLCQIYVTQGQFCYCCSFHKDSSRYW